ncbi:sperm-egg fusion protein TMEM95 [Microcaecilia unicolor]|uniref:Transmembrane protein 95 n=1 Tax=Microcaecilia unicolor TaxID=1415580 RepID=A0A6P7WS94_9AMPH|nr:transmembrane protein 95 [Microcaecilia unicolor]
MDSLLLCLTFLPLALLQTSRCCVFCQMKSKNVERRFQRLCNFYREVFGTNSCTKYPSREDFAPFGLDVEAMKMVTEKTHRVFRVIEIKEEARLADVETYWDWLVEVKLPELTKELLCPPVCHDITKGINCSTCKKKAMRCLSLKTCYPDQMDIFDTVIVLACSSALSIVAGCILCVVEFRYKK